MLEGIQSQNCPNSNTKVNKSEMLGINDSKMNKTAAQIIKPSNISSVNNLSKLFFN